MKCQVCVHIHSVPFKRVRRALSVFDQEREVKVLSDRCLGLPVMFWLTTISLVQHLRNVNGAHAALVRTRSEIAYIGLP